MAIYPPSECREQNTSEAIRLATSALQRCEQHGLGIEKRLPLGDLGAALIRVDEDSAENYLKQSRQIATTIGDQTQSIFCNGHLGQLYLQRGDAATSHTYFTTGLETANQLNSQAQASWLHIGLANVYSLTQSKANAAEHLSAANHFAKHNGLRHEYRVALALKNQIGV